MFKSVLLGMLFFLHERQILVTKINLKTSTIYLQKPFFDKARDREKIKIQNQDNYLDFLFSISLIIVCPVVCGGIYQRIKKIIYVGIVCNSFGGTLLSG
ncbi:MAG: hypothetical protein ACI85O_000466 [Saprospiraceae bacterium]|jgi:hypothetical protein